MSLYVQVPIQQIADGLTAIGWSSAGGGGDATLSYSATAPETPVNGTLWYDTTATLLKLYTGGTWTTINVSAETIATISGYVTLAKSAANDASNSATQALAAKNAITGMQVATGAAGSSVTWNGTTLTVPQGIQGEIGPQGPAGEVTNAQLTTALTSKADKALPNTFSAPQRTSTSASSNAIDFRIANNFTIDATAAYITTVSLIGCTGQSGVLVINNAQNITGWGVAFMFKTTPTNLSGTEVFAYYIESETNVRIGKLS